MGRDVAPSFVGWLSRLVRAHASFVVVTLAACLALRVVHARGREKTLLDKLAVLCEAQRMNTVARYTAIVFLLPAVYHVVLAMLDFGEFFDHILIAFCCAIIANAFAALGAKP